ncbi:hypothetical protein [Paenibacillus popilliae]|uniref:Transcriptional regulator n=1 Tax=Paenibacillus popilliae TaxID=78057 RepID=A0ABY3AQF0_PAEPP|nr:hypothetical protein [Paenibacillus sp. SDF0028]TQR44521.1 hypothetical protein C7Y44_15505 [Paenibacillus sp. SDF0028]
MGNFKLNDAQQSLIEDFGTYIESSGGARSLGKIWGYLLLAGEPRSLDQMVLDLQISKGTASLSVRQGVQVSLFCKVGIPWKQTGLLRTASGCLDVDFAYEHCARGNDGELREAGEVHRIG